MANLIFALAPALGVWLWQHGVEREQFFWGSAVAIAGTASLWLLPKRHDVHTQKQSRTIVMRSLWVPTIVFLIAASLYSGINYSAAVLAFAQRGIGNPALIFTATAIVTAAIRYPAGRLVDRFGSRYMAIPIALFELLGCLVAAYAHNAFQVMLAGGLLGVSWGAIVPVGVGLFFEYSSRRTRGAAMGAYNLALNLGSAVGAVGVAIFTHIGWGYGGAMLVAAVLPVLALPFVFIRRKAT
jgi:MFS family permease